MKPVLVALAGGSGSGKSWASRRLQELAGGRVARIALDDFYHDLSHLPPSRRKRVNFDHPSALDWERLRAVLARVQRGESTDLPVYDFTTHTRSPTARTWRPAPVVLVDGLWPWQPPGLRDHFHYRVFLEAPPHLRLERRLARDTAERGRGARAVRRRFRRQVVPMHDRFVQPQSLHAHRVLASPVSTHTLQMLWEDLHQL